MRIGDSIALKVARKWGPALLLLGAAWPAMAAKSVNVGQLEQMLDSLRNKSDAKVAGELSDLELTERVSPARLAHWEQEFPGPKAHEALIKLADLAAFLNPPAADVLPIPGPDSETQEHMLALAADYMKTTMTRLPNFIATRETTHFEDTPSSQTVNAGPMGSGSRGMRGGGLEISSTQYKSLHSAGSFSVTVTYRDGFEVHNGDDGKSNNPATPTRSLTTSGEFGPVLSVVLGDALRSQVEWQRWEKGAGEPVAVMRYAVPAEQSNYLVGIPSGGKLDNVYPGYRGEIAIDPATGAILRLSLMAELPPPYQAMQNAILVEYAPVTIGAQNYICPVHSVAFSRVPVARGAAGQQDAGVNVQTQVNDVTFTGYHLFRSESRIVTGEGANVNAPAATQSPADSTGATPAPNQP